MFAQIDLPFAFTYAGFIVSGVENNELLSHEYGHLVQEEKYGIAYPLIVGLPSFVSMVIGVIKNDYKTHPTRAFEREATRLGAL